MAKKKKNANVLRVRKKFENLAFVGTSGKFQYDEPKLLKDFSIEELIEFKNSHDEKTVNRYLVGEIPKDTKKPAEDLPKKPA
jgi:hypothetical protein